MIKVLSGLPCFKYKIFSTSKEKLCINPLFYFAFLFLKANY